MKAQLRGIPFGVIFSMSFVGGCNCHGRGQSPVKDYGNLAARPAALNFGNVPIGNHQSLLLTLLNDGGGELTIPDGGQEIIGDVTGSFSAKPFQLDYFPGNTSSALVTFSPNDGGLLTAELEFPYDGPNAPLIVDLQGTGLDINVVCAPPSVDFGPVQVGVQPARTKTVTCTNQGRNNALISFDATNTDPQFTVTDMNNQPVSNVNQFTLTPGQSYTVTVAFEPARVGNVSSSFNYTPCADATTCAGATPIPLNGVGVTGTVAILPNPISYMGVPVGSTANQTITVTNVGSNAVSVGCVNLKSMGAAACGQASPLFSFTGLPAGAQNLAAGASFTFTLVYAPSGGTADADELDAQYTSAGSTTLATATDPITGNQVVAPCALSITPASLSFGTVTIGTPVVKAATLKNNGQSTCNISGVAIDTTTSDPSYTLDATQQTSFTIGAGATATITVDFNLNASNTPNQRRGNVDFASDDPNHATGHIPLIAYLQTNNPYANGWPKWHYDNNNGGRTVADTSNFAGTLAWKFAMASGSAGGFFIASYINSPVVGDHAAGGYTVYQVSMDGMFYALDPNGAVLWKSQLSDPSSDSHPSTPIVLKDESVFVCSGTEGTGTPADPFSQGPDYYHFTSTGTLLDSHTYGIEGFAGTPSLDKDGDLFQSDDDGIPTPGDDSDPSDIMSFSVSNTGVVTQTHGLKFAFAPTAQNGTLERFGLVVNDDDSSFWCVEGSCIGVTAPSAGFQYLPGWPAKGIQVGDPSQTQVISDMAIDPIVNNNLYVYAAWQDFNTGNIVGLLNAYDPMNPGAYPGMPKWSLTLPSGPAPATGGVSMLGNAAPAVDVDGTVYVGSATGLVAVDGATGAQKWVAPCNDVVDAPAIGGDGTVFFGCNDGQFYAVHPDGTLRWKYSTGTSPVSGSPAIADDGTVFVISDDGTLWAFR